MIQPLNSSGEVARTALGLAFERSLRIEATCSCGKKQLTQLVLKGDWEGDYLYVYLNTICMYVWVMYACVSVTVNVYV